MIRTTKKMVIIVIIESDYDTAKVGLTCDYANYDNNAIIYTHEACHAPQQGRSLL